MKVTWESPRLILELQEDEITLTEHLVKTRGISVLEMDFNHFLMGRIDTIKAELRRDIINKVIPSSATLKELQEKLESL